MEADTRVQAVINQFRESLLRSEWSEAAKTIQKHKNIFFNCPSDVFSVIKNDLIAKLIYAATENDYSEVVEVLIHHGCNINYGLTTAFRPHPRSPLYHAAKLGHVPIVKMLLDAGCDRNALNNTGNTALYEAVFEGHVEVVQLLLESGSDPNIPDCYGKTPMHILPFSNASTNDTIQCIKLLVKNGANLSLLCASNQTATDLSIQYKYGLTLYYLMDKAQELDIHTIPLCPHILGDRVLPELLLTGGGLTIGYGSSEGGHVIGMLLVQLHPCHEITPHTMEEFIRVCEREPTPLYDFHAQARKFFQLMLLSGISPLPLKTVLTLQQICRIAIRRHLKERSWYSLPHLPLPKGLQDFLQLKDIINIDSHYFIH